MGGIELEEKRYCKNCGRELEENAKFCGKCGQKVEPVRQEEKKISNEKHCRREKKKIKWKMAAGAGIAVLVVVSVAAVAIVGIQKRTFEKNSEEIMAEKEDKKEKKNSEQDKYMALVQMENGVQ